MALHNIPPNILFEGYMFSDKTVSCDLEEWGKNKNTLFVVGIPASGKSTLGKKIAKNYNSNYYELDKIWEDIVSKYYPNFDPWKDEKLPMPEKELTDKTINIIKEKIRKSQKLIIEGVQIVDLYNHNPSFKRFVNQYPCIILGTSILKAGYRSIKRKKSNASPTWRDHLKWMKNYPSFQKEVKEFRKSRINVPDTEVKKFNTSALTKN